MLLMVLSLKTILVVGFHGTCSDKLNGCYTENHRVDTESHRALVCFFICVFQQTLFRLTNCRNLPCKKKFFSDILQMVNRKTNNECGSFSWCGLTVNGSFMFLNYFFCDCQSKPGSFSRIFGCKKRVENAV
jgi:hypothetical protein